MRRKLNKFYFISTIVIFAIMTQEYSVRAGRWLSDHNCGSNLRETQELELGSKIIENDFDFAQNYLTRGLEYGSHEAI